MVRIPNDPDLPACQNVGLTPFRRPFPDVRSDEEFISKLGGTLQEADESLLWLELLREECSIAPTVTQPLEKESSELIAIFTTMINRTRSRAQ